jgi:DNA repair protein RecO
MYSIHTTPGFIVDTRPTGEAGKLLSIFTRNFGLIMATAQGIRFEHSKLRYHAQQYTFGEFSLVKGKEFWRLTNAADDSRVDFLHLNNESKEFIARLASLLTRFLHGEEEHSVLFDVVHEAAVFLSAQKDIAGVNLKAFESIIVLRMLNTLGYVGSDKTVAEYCKDASITRELLNRAEVDRQLMNQHINRALRESHL